MTVSWRDGLTFRPWSFVFRPSSLVAHRQQHQRRHNRHPDLLGGQRQTEGKAGERGPDQSPRRRRAIAEQPIERQQIGQYRQRFAEEGAAVGPRSRGEGKDERAQRGAASATAQLEQREIDQRGGRGHDDRAEEHHPLHTCGERPAPQVQRDRHDHLRRLIIRHHVAARREDADVGVIPIDLVGGERAALDETIDAAEERAFVVAFERAVIGDDVYRQNEEENTDGNAAVRLAQYRYPRRECLVIP